MPQRNSQRRVVIGGDDRPQRKGRFPRATGDEALGPVQAKPRNNGRIIVPTGDHRHMTKIRLGTLDTSTCFSKERLATIAVDPDAELDQALSSKKEVEQAVNELSGREEEGADNAESQEQEAAEVLLRSGEEKRKRNQPRRSKAKGSTRKGVQKDAKPREKAKDKPKTAKPKAKVTKKPTTKRAYVKRRVKKDDK